MSMSVSMSYVLNITFCVLLKIDYTVDFSKYYFDLFLSIQIEFGTF